MKPNLYAVDPRTDAVVDEDDLTRVFRYVLDAGALTDWPRAGRELGLSSPQLEEAVEQLVHHRLLQPSREAPDQLVAVDPSVAAAVLVSPMEQEICRRQEQVARVRDRAERLRLEYVAAERTHGGTGGPGAAGGTGGGLVPLHGHEEIEGHLGLAAQECRTDLLVVWSGSPDDLLFHRVLELCHTVLGSGAAVRLVCQHRTRADLVTRAALRQLTDDGVQLRTLAQVPRSALVFDQATAVLLGDDDQGSRVRDATLVTAFLLPVLEHLWEAAVVADPLAIGYGDASEDLTRNLLRLMAAGHTDEVVARKLGMSVRSCRRHIAELMRELGAVSRFQAGIRAGAALEDAPVDSPEPVSSLASIGAAPRRDHRG